MPISDSQSSNNRNNVRSQRQLRVGELLRKTLVEIFGRVEFRDPDISGVSITITEVSVSPDLKTARVYVMPLGGSQQFQVISGLGRASRFLRSQVASRIKLRHVPHLIFRIDTAFDYGSSINQLIQSGAVNIDKTKVTESDDGT